MNASQYFRPTYAAAREAFRSCEARAELRRRYDDAAVTAAEIVNHVVGADLRNLEHRVNRTRRQHDGTRGSVDTVQCLRKILFPSLGDRLIDLLQWREQFAYLRVAIVLVLPPENCRPYFDSSRTSRHRE